MAGPTPRFQLIVEAVTRGEAELQRLTGVVNKLTADIERSNARVSTSNKKLVTESKTTGDSIRQALSNPLDGVIEKLTAGAGRMALFTGAAVALGAAVFDAANATSELAEQQSNNATRLGVSIREYGIFSQISKEAGLESDSLVVSIKELSKALLDNSVEGDKGRDALRKIGVEAKNSYGAVRPIKDLLLDIADGLGKIQDPSERARRAIDILGRGGVANLPILNSELRATYLEMEKMGVGFSDIGAKNALKFDAVLDVLGRRVDIVKRKFGELAAVALLSGSGGGKQVQNILATFLSPGAALAFMSLEDMAKSEAEAGRVDNKSDLKQLQLDLEAIDRRKRKGQIDKILGVDPRVILEKAQADLKRSIDDLDVKGVASGKRRVTQAEAEVQAVEKLKALKESIIELELKSGLNPPNELEQINIAQAKELKRAKEAFAPQSDIAKINAAFESQKSRLNFGPLASFTAVPVDMRKGEEINVSDPALDREKNERERALNTSFAQQFVSFQERKIDMLTGPGGELAAINEIFELKKVGLEQELKYGSDIFNLKERQFAIENERELSLLNLRRQRRDEARGLASDFVGSLQSGNPAGFLKQQGGRLLNQIGTNALQGTFTRLQSTLGGIGAASGFGGLLKGTLFDPQNAKPIDRVATATERTAAAAETTAAVLTGRSVGGVSLPGAAGLPGFDAIRALGPLGGFTSGFLTKLGQVGAGASSVLAAGGLFAGLRSRSIQTGPGTATTAAGLGLNSSTSRAANVAGSTAFVAGAGISAFRDFRRGGAGNILSGTATVLGTAAALDPEPISKAVLAIAAASAAIIGSMLPDPKQTRDKRINELLNSSMFEESAPTQFNMDRFGRGFDQNKRGQYRDMPPIQINISTMDARSFSDNRELIADAVRMSIYEGHGINRAMQEAVLAS